ncbi:hypothetical protein [Pengzhenrongella sp.]|jgi:glycosyltransferase involved in cell wall biosynthesis|uniref:hypothetical protein n=1 Tax=Pengzhenrongella sp. TaxID=2888820 RepID=UPI002F93E658
MSSEQPSVPYAACTIVARNYVAYARVLEASFRKTNPGVDFITLIIDGTEADRVEAGPSIVCLLDDLGLDSAVLEPMVVMYSVMELATALKPSMLQALLRWGYSAVAYFDPDILVLGDLTDLYEEATAHATVLTPHALAPIARDGLEIQEKTIMHSGIYNLGFIAVGTRSAEFLEWWHERLLTDAVVDFENALFTDQRWIDWVPALFEHAISRDPGLNVAYWNAHERPLTRGADGEILASGRPLRFFHFSGFDMKFPWLLSRFMGDQPRVLLSERPVLRELCHAYADALHEQDYDRRRTQPYRFAALENGPVLTPVVRSLYRDATTGALPLQPPPAHPVSDPAGLVRWLRTPVQCAPWARLAPADIGLWRSRPDLRRRFPSPLGAASWYLRRWLDTDPSVVDFYRDHRLGEPESSARSGHYGARRRSGWSVVACGEPEPSGEARTVARRVAREATRAGIPTELVEPLREDRRPFPLWIHRGVGAHQVHDNVIVCVDAQHLSEDRIVQALAGRPGHRIGLWLSADTSVGADERHILELFDELWVLSRTTELALKTCTKRPVRLVCLPHRTAGADVTTADQLPWLDEIRGSGPLFLLSLDAGADVEQQNPGSAIDAFRRAFCPEDDARLLIHVRNAALTRHQIEMIRHAQGDRTDVVLVTAEVGEGAEGRVVERVDCIVSLHRRSAYGVALADAASFGTPIVATGYSAPMSYLDEDRALLVPFSLVLRTPRSAVRPGETLDLWAEPDVEAAGRAMRTIVEDAGRVARMVEKARASSAHGAQPVRDRLRLSTLEPGR